LQPVYIDDESFQLEDGRTNLIAFLDLFEGSDDVIDFFDKLRSVHDKAMEMWALALDTYLKLIIKESLKEKDGTQYFYYNFFKGLWRISKGNLIEQLGGSIPLEYTTQILRR